MSAKQFVFATCGATENAWLKREVARRAPQYHLAFSCPGFVTWRMVPDADAELGKVVAKSAVGISETPSSVLELSAVARVSGVSLGKSMTPDSLPDLFGEIREKLRAIHVFWVDSATTVRASSQAVEAAVEVERAHVLETWQESVRHLFPELDPDAPEGSLVADIMLVPNGKFAWVGYHAKSAFRASAPGGVTRCPVPDYAPSRAYAKVVELLALAELTPARGWRAIELGAAPGGGTLALLERGVNVTAVDPAALEQGVMVKAASLGVSLNVLQKAAAELTAEELPRTPDLLVTDVNLAPSVSLNYIERVAKLSRGPKQAILMTWKINDEKVEKSIPELLARARSIGERFGLGRLRFVHLPSQRREIGVTLSR